MIRPFENNTETFIKRLAKRSMQSEGRALVIGVDSLAGRVRFFEDMTEKSAVNSITPLEEGKGLG